MVERGGWKPQPKEEKFDVGSPGGGGTPKGAEGQGNSPSDKQQERRLIALSDPEYEGYSEKIDGYLQRMKRWFDVVRKDEYFVGYFPGKECGKYTGYRWEWGFDIALADRVQITPGHNQSLKKTMERVIGTHRRSRDESMQHFTMEVIGWGNKKNKGFIDPYNNTPLLDLSFEARKDGEDDHYLRIDARYPRPKTTDLADMQVLQYRLRPWGFRVKDVEEGREIDPFKDIESLKRLEVGLPVDGKAPAFAELMTEDHAIVLFNLMDSIILPAGQGSGKKRELEEL